MCGIAGLISCGDRGALDRMTGALSHRGPDDSGLEWFPETGSGLGHRRLSILDLSPAGHQPMSNESGELWIVHNGEVYNFRDVRTELMNKGYRFHSQSDTEVILKAFDAWGPGCLQRFNGMFAFAIYNSRTGSLFLARDRIGVKPLYYHAREGSLAFASEIKGILASGLAPKEPDLYALHTPTRFQLSPYTGFKDILKLLPGHYLLLDRTGLKVEPYWTIAPHERYAGTTQDAVAELNELVQDAVRLQMVADVPVGIFLSGGLDSSIIAALMKRNAGEEIHAFTIRFSEQDQQFEKMVDDSVYARQVASMLDFRYHEFEIRPDVADLLPKMVWHMDEPLADPAAINTYLMAKSAREHGIVVLLNGMGGDEIFGGYRKHLACLKAEVYQKFVPGLVRSTMESIVTALPVATSRQGLRFLRWSKRFLSFASMPRAERYMASDLSLSASQYDEFFANGTAYDQTHFYRTESGAFDQKSLSYLTQMCLNDTRYFLPEHNLTYSDKASMAAAVEGRPPLTDHRVVEFMFSLPPRFRINGNSQKHILKQVALSYLPKHIVHRPKAPFGSPLRSWIRGPLSGMVDDYLSESSIRKRGLYNPGYISGLIRRDREGREDNAHLIWTLLTMEIWFKTFFDS